jgi:hypothetical protein
MGATALLTMPVIPTSNRVAPEIEFLQSRSPALTLSEPELELAEGKDKLSDELSAITGAMQNANRKAKYFT